MVDRSIIEAIRERVDLVEVVSVVVTLKRAGTSLKGLCPFHEEKTPSFHVVPHKGIFHCFGCGEGGDAFKFVMKTRGLDFMEAVRELGQQVGVEIAEQELSVDERRRIRVRTDLYGVMEEAARFYQSVLLTRPEGAGALAYLRERGMSSEMIERFRLGYSPDSWDALLNHLHRMGIGPDLAVQGGLARRRDGPRGGAYDFLRGRLMIPIEDDRGRVVAFGARILQGEGPKYINTPETPLYNKSKILYGLSQARQRIQRVDRAIVVEGYFDVMSLHQAGFTEAVAVSGAALTADQVRILRRLAPTLIAQFDSDSAGVRAAVRSMEACLEVGLEPLRLSLGGAKDPDEFIQAHGAEAFESLLANSRPLFDLVLQDSVERNGYSPDGRQRTLVELGPLVRRFPDGARDRVVEQISREIGVSESHVRERVGQAPSQAPSGEVARPLRWRGTKALNHLIWLLIHHHALVIDEVAGADLQSWTDHPAARQAIGRLVAGEPLASILDSVTDPDVGRVLRELAARDGEYDADNAAAAARQIVRRNEMRAVDEELGRLSREISACVTSGDRSRYLALSRQRQDLQRRRLTILQSIPGKSAR